MVRCEPYCPMRMDTLLDAPRQPIERSGLDEVDEAKLGVLNRLAAADYSFASPAPSTQRRVLLRRGKVDATDLTDIFGWNLPFAAELIDSELFDLMRRGEMLRLIGGAG